MRQCEALPLDKAQSVFGAKTHSNKNRRHRKITQQLRLYGLFLRNGPPLSLRLLLSSLLPCRYFWTREYFPATKTSRHFKRATAASYWGQRPKKRGWRFRQKIFYGLFHILIQEGPFKKLDIHTADWDCPFEAKLAEQCSKAIPH